MGLRRRCWKDTHRHNACHLLTPAPLHQPTMPVPVKVRTFFIPDVRRRAVYGMDDEANGRQEAAQGEGEGAIATMGRRASQVGSERI